MTATVQNISVAGAQPFQVRVNGLNPGTKLKAFFDGNPIESTQLRQVVRSGSNVYTDQLYDVYGLNVNAGELITDRNGSIEFIFYYNDALSNINVTSEQAAYQYAEAATGIKSLIVIDEASAASITETLANVVGSNAKTNALRAAKCYAESFINITYSINFKEIRSTISTSSGATASVDTATAVVPAAVATAASAGAATSTYYDWTPTADIGAPGPAADPGPGPSSVSVTESMSIQEGVINGMDTVPNETQTVVGLQDYGPDGGGGGDGGGSDCFTADTLVTLLEGQRKPISEVKIGDLVLNASGTGFNEVKYVERVYDTQWDLLYSPSASYKPFVTINHPLIIGGVLQAPEPEKTYTRYPWLGKPERLVVTNTVPTTGQVVYNLWVDGDGTYTVNGYGTTSIIGDGGAVSRGYRRGFLSENEVLENLRLFSEGDKFTQYGAYLTNKWLGKTKNNTIVKATSSILRSEVGRTGLVILANAVGRVAWLFK